jgi:hypothetical protein
MRYSEALKSLIHVQLQMLQSLRLSSVTAPSILMSSIVYSGYLLSSDRVDE